MSHEGIRFVREDEASEAAARTKAFSPAALAPAHVRVNKTAGTGMEIDWQDGHQSAWTFAWLRHACPCATCHQERDAEGRAPGVPRPARKDLLPMYQAPPRPEEATPVGKYAVRFKWNDGHESGIYSWDYLRRVCQCDECKRSRQR